MVAAATGLAVRGYKPFASTFAAFFTRAYDFIRMGAISGRDVRAGRWHAGVEIGADGPSQMALEDLAMMRAVHGSTVLYPADGTSTAVLVKAMAATPGVDKPTCAAPPAADPGLYRRGNRPSSAAPGARFGEQDAVTLVGAASRCTSALASPSSWPRGHRRPGHRLLSASSRSEHHRARPAAARATGGCWPFRGRRRP